MIRCLVAGGQTGVDRAALDVARALGIPSRGWCPAGRWAEDGPLPDHYPLEETPSADPIQRTEWNVRDSEATLVVSRDEPRGGSAHALAEARRRGRPTLAIRLGAAPAAADIARARDWLDGLAIAVLNVAGPRESEEPGIEDQAAAFLRELLGPQAQNE